MKRWIISIQLFLLCTLFLFLANFYISVVEAYQIQNEEGDIAVWMFPAVQQGAPLYEFQTAITAYTAKMQGMKLWRPFFGYPAHSWDDSNYPLLFRAFCGHIQPLRENASLPDGISVSPYIVLVLRLAPEVRAAFDLKGMINAYHAFFDSNNWREQYRIPFFEVEQLYYSEIERSDFTPMIGENQTKEEYFDITNPNFFPKRCYNCASMTAWSLIAAWYAGADASLKESILGLFVNGQAPYTASDIIISIDLVTPGTLCQFLVRIGLAKIVDVVDFGGTLTDLQKQMILEAQ